MNFKTNEKETQKMKNLLIKLSLVVAMIIACNTALAVFTDTLSLFGIAIQLTGQVLLKLHRMTIQADALLII